MAIAVLFFFLVTIEGEEGTPERTVRIEGKSITVDLIAK